MNSSAQVLRQVLANSFVLPTALGSAHFVSRHNDSLSSCDQAVSAPLGKIHKPIHHKLHKRQFAKGANVSIDATKENSNSNSSRPVNLKARMTSIGRFSLQSETDSNPSLPTFFVALSGSPNNVQTIESSQNTNINKPDDRNMSVTEFINLWNQKNLSNRHPRFHSKVSTENDSYFEFTTPNLQKHVSESLPYYVPRLEFKGRIESFLTNMSELPLNEILWEAQITNGPLGSSGAISRKKVEQIMMKNNLKTPNLGRETVVLFRSHHCIGDGVSLAAALMDLADESEMFQQMIRKEMKKRRKKPKGYLQKLRNFIKRLLWFWIGSIKAVSYQGYLFLTSRTHPFQFILDQYPDSSSENEFGRSVSWCDAAPLLEVNQVAKILFPKATVNDLFVACVSAAVRRQIACHASKPKTHSNDDSSSILISSPTAAPTHVNVVIPVHLMGGVLPPGYSLGNKIGAIAARVPTSGSSPSLLETSQTLSYLKKTPTALMSHLLAKLVASCFPSNIATHLFANSNNNAAFVLSNVRGPAQSIHWNGREIVSMGGFVPLPPGVYIGVAVQSYNGIVSLTVNADKRIVPNADLFLEWVLEEYTIMSRSAEKKLLEKGK